jgi:hypothetical protein
MRYRAFATLLLVALCAWSVYAQSGRKHAKTAPATPVPTPTPEASPAPKKVDKQTEPVFYIGADRNDTYATVPFTYHDAALRGCVNRLRAGTAGAVDVNDRSMNRGDAIKKAKAEKTTYVVLLTLKIDNMSRNYDDLIIDFVVFAPGTAKIVTQGHSYPNANRAGPLIVGPPTSRGSNSIYYERMLQQAGEDAGNRILKALNLDQIPKQPSSFTRRTIPQSHPDTSHQ